MKKISEIARLTGVSVRTLHYYDEIGLLRPSYTDSANGYRYYDNGDIERLREIMFYRELDFPLKSIVRILSSSDYNKTDALMKQKKLLMLKKERIEQLIGVLESAVEGENIMGFDAFSKNEYEAERKRYEAEAKEKWGKTDAYNEYEEKHSKRSGDKSAEVNKEMLAIFAEFSVCMKSGAKPSDESAQLLVKKLRDFISANFYNCTNDILAGLGQMYTADERFIVPQTICRQY